MTGVEFKTARQNLGYSRRSLADDIGRAKETVKSWETGKRPVPKYAERFLARLAR